jgi:hypothetical protein
MTKPIVLAMSLLVPLVSCSQMSNEGPAPVRPIEIAVFGDMPYGDTVSRSLKNAEYMRVLRSIEEAKPDVIVHIGDIGLPGQCSDSIYHQRLSEFRSVRRPLIYLYGDNEWTDCASGGFDPLERLAKLRSTFAAERQSLGSPNVPITRQGGQTPENVRWVQNRVVFVGLHLVGSNNNWGDADVASLEHQHRAKANIEWLTEAFDFAERNDAPALVLFTHANPLPSAAGRGNRPNGFADVMAEFRRLAKAFGRPIALVHGDTHYFRIDMPFVEPTRRVLPNVIRAETFGDPNSHWLQITVDPAQPQVFTFRPMIVFGNASVN